MKKFKWVCTKCRGQNEIEQKKAEQQKKAICEKCDTEVLVVFALSLAQLASVKKAGQAGAEGRLIKLTPARRQEIARNAAEARWLWKRKK